jgi:hypothetical protein
MVDVDVGDRVLSLLAVDVGVGVGGGVIVHDVVGECLLTVASDVAEGCDSDNVAEGEIDALGLDATVSDLGFGIVTVVFEREWLDKVELIVLVYPR